MGPIKIDGPDSSLVLVMGEDNTSLLLFFFFPNEVHHGVCNVVW